MLNCCGSVEIIEQKPSIIELTEGNCEQKVIEVLVIGPQGPKGDKGDTFVPEGGADNDVLLKSGALPVYGDVKESNTTLNLVSWYTLAKNGDLP